MKLKALPFFILLLVVSLTKAQIAESSKGRIKQYDKRVTFDIRLEPTCFLGIKGNEVIPAVPNWYAHQEKINSKLNTNYEGLLVGFGVAIDKRFHVDAIGGFEKMNYDANVNMATEPFDVIAIPIGIDAHINILKHRFSPFIHLGGGYMGYWITPNDPNPGFNNSAFVTAGLGFYARLNSFLALAISPDYRLIFYNYSFTSYDMSDMRTSPVITAKTYVQQVGLHLAIIFY